MRERARDLGAKFEFASSAGKGTQIDICLEARRAYTQRDGCFPWKSRSSRWLAAIRQSLPGRDAFADEDIPDLSLQGDALEGPDLPGIGDLEQQRSKVLIQ